MKKLVLLFMFILIATVSVSCGSDGTSATGGEGTLTIYGADE